MLALEQAGVTNLNGQWTPQSRHFRDELGAKQDDLRSIFTRQDLGSSEPMVSNLSKEVLHSPDLEEVLKTLQKNLESTSELPPSQFVEEDITLLYELAYNLYQVNEFAQAGEIFQRLVIAKPFEPKYWQAFASCLHMQKKYQEALVPWSMWCLIDDTNPFPHFHAAESLFSLSEKEEGLKALKTAEALDIKGVLRGKIEALRLAWEEPCLT